MTDSNYSRSANPFDIVQRCSDDNDTRNAFIQVLGDWRSEGCGGKIRAQTAQSYEQGKYGQWAVFAEKTLIEGAQALSAVKGRLENLVLSTEGTFIDHEKKNDDAGFAYNDTGFQSANFIYDNDLRMFIEKVKQSRKMKLLITTLKNLFWRVKTGGTVVITACFIGRGDMGTRLASSLKKLSGYRLDFYLATGFANLTWDEPSHQDAKGLKIEGSQNGYIKGHESTPGWRLFQRSGGSGAYSDLIIRLTGAPICHRFP